MAKKAKGGEKTVHDYSVSHFTAVLSKKDGSHPKLDTEIIKFNFYHKDSGDLSKDPVEVKMDPYNPDTGVLTGEFKVTNKTVQEGEVGEFVVVLSTIHQDPAASVIPQDSLQANLTIHAFNKEAQIQALNNSFTPDSKNIFYVWAGKYNRMEKGDSIQLFGYEKDAAVYERIYFNHTFEYKSTLDNGKSFGFVIPDFVLNNNKQNHIFKPGQKVVIGYEWNKRITPAETIITVLSADDVIDVSKSSFKLEPNTVYI